MADFASIDGLSPAVARWINSTPVGANIVLSRDWRAVALALALNTEWTGGQYSANFWSAARGLPVVTYFKMRGMDAAIDGLYDTWLVAASPDNTGTRYDGELATPLRDIIVIDEWETQ